MRYLLIFLLLLPVGCSREPKLRFEPGEEQIRSIAALKQLYTGYPMPIAEELYIEGIVVSSDREGNFSHSLIVEDATGGIEIRVGIDDIYRHYQRGVRLRVRCNTLIIGAYGGSVQLEGKEGPIAAEQLSSHLRVIDPVPRIPDPQLIAIEQLAPRWVNCRVRFEGLEVVREEQGMMWGEVDRDVDRHLVDVRRDTLTVRIDAGSELAAMPMPRGSRAIEGILSYFNGYQLRPLSAADIQ